MHGSMKTPAMLLAAFTLACAGAPEAEGPAPQRPIPEPPARPSEMRADVPGRVPTPASYLGFAVGEDRRLADWVEVTGYLSELARRSPRVLMDTLGPTTLDRPFVMLTISSPENLARLDRYRELNRRLADPRRISSDEEAERLIAEGKAIVLITSSIHSTEVGGIQVPMLLAHRLASSDDPSVRKILDEVILLLVPSLNPDGAQMVVDWYEETVGEPWEGASPPFLYHHYVGHDNNRDWYFFTQPETRHAVRDAHNAWHPQIVHDIHQQGQRGSRLFIPPWIDPIEPNVDPLLIQAANDLGTHMAWKVAMEGKKGVVVNATYDGWTPARAYQHYHAGVRILTETASADLASPIEVPFDQLEQGRNFHAQRASWNFPDPWPGGEWRLADIVDYMDSGALALLEHAADNREEWLRNFYRIGRRAVDRWPSWPEAWLIPGEQRNEIGLQELLRVLTTADVEVHRAEAPFRAGGRSFAAGTYVIPMSQPYASFAQTMLERQDYPDLRVYPGGPPRAPYDVTAHTLPLLLGVEAVAADAISPALSSLPLSAPIATPTVQRHAPGLSGGAGPRIALYQSYAPSMDEGWTRWIFDEYDIAYTTVHDADVRAGDLDRRFDVVLLPSQSPSGLMRGRPAGSVPPELAGGLGSDGVRALRSFVERGGTLVALEEASAFVIEAFDLPIHDRVEELEQSDFYIPGSILELRLEPDHPLTRGLPRETIAWFERGSMAFQATARTVSMPGRYAPGEPLLSGWALGQPHVAGAGALADVRLGDGRIVLFGFRPQYRAQPVATFPLLFNALRRGKAGSGS